MKIVLSKPLPKHKDWMMNMDIKKLSIGQMAELNRVTTQTLRYYDKEGLLSPCFTDPNTGYRYYHINQSAQLDMIQYLQSHGISLRKIKKQLELNGRDTEAFISLLKSQLLEIDENIRRLSQSKNTISRMLENYERYKNLPLSETLFFEYIPKRKIFIKKTHYNLFEQNFSGYEMMLRELKQSLVLSDLPFSYFCNTGTIVRKKFLDSGELFSDEVFFFVEEDYSGPGFVEDIPPNLYICVCSKDFSREASLAKRLFSEISNLNYEIEGDYLCEVMLDFPGFDAEPRNLFYRIQIPVKRSDG